MTTLDIFYLSKIVHILYTYKGIKIQNSHFWISRIYQYFNSHFKYLFISTKMFWFLSVWEGRKKHWIVGPGKKTIPNSDGYSCLSSLSIHSVLLSALKWQVSQTSRERLVLMWMRHADKTPNYSKMLISIFQNSKDFY